jgi:hypothetical protein
MAGELPDTKAGRIIGPARVLYPKLRFRCCERGRLLRPQAGQRHCARRRVGSLPVSTGKKVAQPELTPRTQRSSAMALVGTWAHRTVVNGILSRDP